MSENPFYDLAETLTEFVDLVNDGVEYEKARSLHIRAVSQYGTCVELLERSGLTDERDDLVMRPVVSALYPPGGYWEGGVSALDRSAVLMVRMLGNEPGLQVLLPSTLTVGELATLRETFVKIHEVVDGHEALPENLKAHLVYLCQRGMDLIDGKDVDLVALRSICFETSGVGFAAGVTLPQSAQGAWFSRLRGLWVWGAKVVTAVAIEQGVDKALESFS